MRSIPRSNPPAPTRSAAYAAIAVLAVLLASACGDSIVGSAEDVREELLVVHQGYFAWIASDGSDLRIHPESLGHRGVSVSPDRAWVAFSDTGPGMKLRRMSTDGTEVVDLDAPGGSHTPRWSSEGALLSIQTEEAIYVIPAMGGSPVDVSSEAIAGDGGCSDTGRGILRNYGFTGDGRVIFSNYVCGVGYHFYSVRIDGSDSRPVTEFDPRRTYWSPDGTRVLSVEDGAVHLMNADGSDRRMLEESGVLPHRFFNSSSPWSLDSRRVAFLAGSGTERSIVVLEVDGPGRAELETGDVWSGISWSRDGRIAFNAPSGEGLAVFVAHPETGVVTQVTPSGERFERPFWVPAR